MLRKINYSTLIIFAVFLGLAPFYPEPHLYQKIKMLMDGTLEKPLDIFDLCFHAAPIVMLIVKFVNEKVIIRQDS